MQMNPTEISEYELFLNKKHILILRELFNNKIKEENVPSIIDLLNRIFIYFVYCKDADSFDKIFRVTINKNIPPYANERLMDLRNIKYPPNPEAIIKYGRCNFPGQSILYASLMRMTSLDEMRPQSGDLITESVWKKKSSKLLVYIPIFSNQPTNKPMVNIETGEIIPYLTNIRTYEMNEKFKQQISHYPKNLKELALLVVQFIADCFSRNVNMQNHFNYIFSAFLADKFFNKIENGKIDAINYPSVQDKLNSENLAIKPLVFDKLYEPWGVIESIVIRDFSEGGYKTEVTGACQKFNFDTNEILWNEKDANEALFKFLIVGDNTNTIYNGYSSKL